MLVLTSTYPRWSGDHEPGFVHELAKRLTGRFHVVVLGPHAPGASTHEILDGVEVLRYRYAPEGWETLVNDGGIVTNLRQDRWKVLLVPMFVGMQFLAAWWLMHRRRVDIVHAHWLVPQGFVATLLQRLPGRRVPFVVTSHGADLFALKGKVFDSLKSHVARSASYVTVVSEPMRRAVLATGAHPDRVRIGPMGVDLSARFVADATVARSEFELLFVGRLVEKKGLKHLINAMPRILADRPDTILTVAGFGPERAVLEDQARRLGVAAAVSFLGPVPQEELPLLYRRAAAFVAPFVEAASGDQEGLGLVLVEALGCGCPVVAGDVPAVKDVLGDSPATVVDASDVAALADAVLGVLADPAASRARAERLRSELLVRLDWGAVAGNYGDLLAGCMRTNSASG